MKTKKCRSGLGTGQWEEGGRIQRSVAESHRSRAMAGKGSEGSKEVRGVHAQLDNHLISTLPPIEP